MGAYAANSDPEIDEAIRLKPAIDEFLRQDSEAVHTLSDSLEGLNKVFAS